MKKIKISLKMRLTILTMSVLICTTVVLTMLMNQNVSNKMVTMQRPIEKAIKVVALEGLDSSIEYVKIHPTEDTLHQTNIYLEKTDGMSVAVLNKPETVENSINAVRVQLINTEKDIKRTSYIMLSAVILISGISVYYLSGRALAPFKKLAVEMQSITANNLSSPINTEDSSNEIRQLSTSFNEMLANLHKSFDMQKKFSANAAHELRTPIAILQSNIEVLEEDENANIEDYKEFMNIANRTITRMGSLVNNLLDMAKSENIEMKDDVDLKKIVEDVCSDIESLCHKDDIKIQNEVSKDLCSIKGNRDMIYRAIYNIVENGIKYNKPKGSVKIISNDDDDFVNLIIKDTGIGIEKMETENIFQAFYRVDKSRSRELGGAGLGLSIVNLIVREHEGKTEVSSIKGEGSVFTIKFRHNI